MGSSCIIHILFHACSGSRVDVVRTKIMAVAAQSQCAVCSFDFSGCGHSDGDYVSAVFVGIPLVSLHLMNILNL